MIARSTRNIVLQFDPAADVLPGGKRLSGGISAAVAIADTLWLTHDETVAIERLSAERTKAASFRYASHRRFDLRDLVSLPAPRGKAKHASPPEADFEGISFCGDYLWVAGSHSAVRDDLGKKKGSEAIAALATVRRSGNRFLLARIPVAGRDAQPALVRQLGTKDGQVLRAARLAGGRKQNALTRALRDDPHLGPFLSIPSKDNGFDIEGLAAAPNGRLFLGLRGPVLDGWACILEIHVAARLDRNNELTLRKSPDHPLAPPRERYIASTSWTSAVRGSAISAAQVATCSYSPVRQCEERESPRFDAGMTRSRTTARRY